jgi:hypothetical protein
VNRDRVVRSSFFQSHPSGWGLRSGATNHGARVLWGRQSCLLPAFSRQHLLARIALCFASRDQAALAPREWLYGERLEKE